MQRQRPRGGKRSRVSARSGRLDLESMGGGRHSS
ncbi:hypothetical protein BCL64_10224 [Halomonas ventosae]|uniref:Uncharacterized protein n=1 Tax=Halomonas ventosae TaxID=229007 RepID=A0A2T0VR15_9GAMM|nr:hypothetical protein BCL64_10224 [Halomonas ventosae]